MNCNYTPRAVGGSSALIASVRADYSLCAHTLHREAKKWVLAERGAAESTLLSVGQETVGILLPFAASYGCETGSSAVAALKTKRRFQINTEKDSALNSALKSCALQNKNKQKKAINSELPILKRKK